MIILDISSFQPHPPAIFRSRPEARRKGQSDSCTKAALRGLPGDTESTLGQWRQRRFPGLVQRLREQTRSAKDRVRRPIVVEKGRLRDINWKALVLGLAALVNTAVAVQTGGTGPHLVTDWDRGAVATEIHMLSWESPDSQLEPAYLGRGWTGSRRPSLLQNIRFDPVRLAGFPRLPLVGSRDNLPDVISSLGPLGIAASPDWRVASPIDPDCVACGVDLPQEGELSRAPFFLPPLKVILRLDPLGPAAQQFSVDPIGPRGIPITMEAVLQLKFPQFDLGVGFQVTQAGPLLAPRYLARLDAQDGLLTIPAAPPPYRFRPDPKTRLRDFIAHPDLDTEPPKIPYSIVAKIGLPGLVWLQGILPSLEQVEFEGSLKLRRSSSAGRAEGLQLSTKLKFKRGDFRVDTSIAVRGDGQRGVNPESVNLASFETKNLVFGAYDFNASEQGVWVTWKLPVRLNLGRLFRPSRVVLKGDLTREIQGPTHEIQKKPWLEYLDRWGSHLPPPARLTLTEPSP